MAAVVIKAVEKYVQAGEYKTHYWEAGAGEPVLLLHPACPGANGGTEFRHTIEPLSEYFRVLAPDLIGFGKTDSPTRMLKHPTYVEHIIEFMKAVDAVPAHLVANCRGGLVAISVAGDHPELVRKLVVIGNAGGGISVPHEIVVKHGDGGRDGDRGRGRRHAHGRSARRHGRARARICAHRHAPPGYPCRKVLTAPAPLPPRPPCRARLDRCRDKARDRACRSEH